MHMGSLGGLRHLKRDSINLGWRNTSFRGFTDYLSCAEFIQWLTEHKQIASRKTTTIMCAEALSWRCHRFLIADALIKKWMAGVEYNVQHKSHKTPGGAVSEGQERATCVSDG